MTKDEALKLALEALEEVTTYTSSQSWSPSMTRDCENAITTIQEALAQPVQVTSGWSLRYVYFDENGIPLMYREPEDRNFCPRCGKRTADLITIHTCTPPRENT